MTLPAFNQPKSLKAETDIRGMMDTMLERGAAMTAVADILTLKEKIRFLETRCSNLEQ